MGQFFQDLTRVLGQKVAAPGKPSLPGKPRMGGSLCVKRVAKFSPLPCGAWSKLAPEPSPHGFSSGSVLGQECFRFEWKHMASFS